MQIKLKYVSREPSGLLMYHRVIPEDLRRHYNGQRLRRLSLGTHDPTFAAKEALRRAKEDDRIWQALRDGAGDLQTATETSQSSVDLNLISRIMRHKAGPPAPRMTDALKEYLRKHEGKGPKFVADVQRVFDFAKDILGNPALKDVKRIDARRVIDAMLARRLKTMSVKRYIATLSAVFNAGVLELEVDTKNPFSSQAIPNLKEDARIIPSFSSSELRHIADAALDQKTVEGLVACVQIETGARCREIALLRVSDVHIDAPIPFIEIKPHKELGRSIKNLGSARVIPLVGVSLAATRLALDAQPGTGWLFDIGHANPSCRVNRWLRRILDGKPGSRSARHSFETRLIHAKIDQRLINSLMGHSMRGMAGVYFSGYSLEDMAAAIERIAIR